MAKPGDYDYDYDRLNSNLAYFSIFGPMVVRQVMDHEAAGKGAPTDRDMDRFVTEANTVASQAMYVAEGKDM